MSFTIASIFIHDQVDYTMVSFYKCCTVDHLKALEFMTVNSSNSAFCRGSQKNPHMWSSKSTIGTSIYQTAMFSLRSLSYMVGIVVINVPLRSWGGILGTWYLVCLVHLKSLVQILRTVTLTIHKVKNGVLRDV